MSTLLQDIRFAIRVLAKRPGFTLPTLTILVLGLAANNAIFGLVNAILLQPLPGIREPHRLIGIASGVISYPSYLDFREQCRAVMDLAAFRERPMAVRAGGESLPGRGQLVSGNYFSVLGGRVVLGRPLSPEDDRPGAPPVAVVSHRFWRGALRGEPGVLGQVLVVNGASAEIVGVAAPGFRGTRIADTPDFFVPIALWPRIAPTSFKGLGLENRGWGWLSAVGRLSPGVTLGQAEAAMNVSQRRQESLKPLDTLSGSSVRLQSAVLLAPGEGSARGLMERFFGLLSLVVGLVLLIACANVANLLLARGNARRREMAVRLAVGASSGRVVRQLLTESLLLSATAGGLSLLAVPFINEALGRFTLPGGTSLAGLDLDPGWPMVTFTSVASLATGILFGLAPALRSIRPDLVGDLKGVPADPAKGRRRMGGPLLVVQVTLSLVLLVGTGLFLRSLQRALSLDPGFRLDHVATATVDLGLARYDPALAGRFYAEAAERVAALPGVRAATWTSLLPLADESDTELISVDGYSPAPNESMLVETNLVGCRYAEVLAIPIVRGREFTPRDAEGALPVALVNESMARRYWPGRDPLGGQVKVRNRTWTVVGVVRDIHQHDLTEEARPRIHLPLSQAGTNAGLFPMKLLAWTRGDPQESLGSIRRQLAGIDPDVPVVQVGALEDGLTELLMPQRLAASLLGWLSILAMAIVAVGIYGSAAYEVTRRTREIGIRVALGARPGTMVRLMVRRNLFYILLGIALGSPVAVALGSVASSFLYGIGAADPPTHALTAGLLLASGLVASYLPARRAAKVDPMTALRCE